MQQEKIVYDWSAGFGGPSLTPWVRCDCPNCRCSTWFDVGNGSTPRAHCCDKEPEYPDGSKWREHLNARPKRSLVAEAEMYGKPVNLASRPTFVVVMRHKIPFFGRKK